MAQMSPAQANSLEQWITKLDEHLLPVLPASARALAQVLKNPEIALHDIGAVVANDPVMTLHLVRECQRQYGNRVEGSLSNVYHCVAMLGLDKMSALARSFKPVDDNPSNLHYIEAVAISLHGAEQVRHWLESRRKMGADQAYIAALIFGLVDACLWHFAPREMRVLQTLTGPEQIPRDEADLAVLGCCRSSIARTLAQRWHFPDPILEALEGAALPAPAFLLRHARRAELDPQHPFPNKDPQGRLVRSTALYLRLACWLAEDSTRGWQSVSIRRCHSILGACLGLHHTDILHLTQEACLNLSQRWPIDPVIAPATGLLWPTQRSRRRRIRPRQLPAAVTRLLSGKIMPAATAKAVQSGTAPATAAPPSRSALQSAPRAAPTRSPSPPKIGIPSHNLPADLDRASILGAPAPAVPSPQPARFPGFRSLQSRQGFEQFIQQMLQQPVPGTADTDVLRTVVEQLHEATELSRVVVALHNPRLDLVEGSFALGCDAFPGLKRYRVKLQPVNLFTHLLKQPAGVWVGPDRPNPVTGLVPGSFKQANQVDEFFLMSVVNHKGPYAVFYADKGLDNRIGLSESEYKIFKAACASCSKHLIAKGKLAASKGEGL